jgi:hypothetical protein
MIFHPKQFSAIIQQIYFACNCTMYWLNSVRWGCWAPPSPFR